MCVFKYLHSLEKLQIAFTMNLNFFPIVILLSNVLIMNIHIWFSGNASLII